MGKFMNLKNDAKKFIGGFQVVEDFIVDQGFNVIIVQGRTFDLFLKVDFRIIGKLPSDHLNNPFT